MNRYGLLTLTALCAVSASAQAPKPTGAALMDKAVTVIGGAAWLKVQSFTSKGTVSVPAQGISGTMEIQAQAPNKFVMKQSLKGMGDSSSAFDGTVGWSKDPFTGLRTLAGAELASLKAQSALSIRPADWKSVYSKAEVLGTVKVAGAPAYRVRLTPKVGNPETQYFDVKTGLQVRSDQTLETPNGKIAVESYFSDYRTVSGIKMAHKIRQLAGPTEVVILLSDVKINAPVEASAFAKPKE
ncbi:MAG: hypothetical protein NTX57_04795 [Armatimonadetes bacterium]|nr:hypothetical protein [Armatimonadota bacterium]